MKKRLLAALSVAMVAVIAITGTMAYLSETDNDVNVMTMGNVEIDQLEYERVVEDGHWVSTGETDKYGYTPDMLKEFTQGKALYPAVFADGAIKWDDRNGSEAASGTQSHQQSWAQIGAPGSSQLFDDSVKNVQDKFVFVKNTGESDAYVRTFIAFEQGDLSSEDFDKIIGTSGNTNHWSWETVATDVEIDGNKYVVACVTYKGPSSNPTGILAPGAVSYPSLLQIYMHPNATNADVKAIDGNENGTYDILVLSQAVQTNGFDSAAVALNAAFGEPTAANLDAWFTEMKIPDVTVHEGVNYVTDGENAKVYSDGGNTVYRGVVSDGQTTSSNVVIGEGITRLNNRSLCKNSNLVSVSLPSTLTYIDESVFQQSGFKEIEIPENVTYIGKTAFGSCPSLEKIIIKSKNVTFAEYVARDCKALKEVYIYSDAVTFESGSMYFTNSQTGDASKITFYVKNQDVANALYNSSSATISYGLLIKSLDGNTVYYNTL